jgi:hypothetical protein
MIRFTGVTIWEDKAGYARCSPGDQYIHRLVTRAQAGQIVDHKDGNKLNNRRSNLRITSQAMNCLNRRINSKSTTGVKGVSFDKAKQKYHAYIELNGKRRNIGYYVSLEKATIARHDAAKKLFGEFTHVTNP